MVGAASRAASSVGTEPVSAVSAAAAIEHPLGVGQVELPRLAQQHEQVVQDVRGLFRRRARRISSRAARATSSASSITFSPIRAGSSSSVTV